MIALACERPAERGQPLSRHSAAEIVREATETGLLPIISPTTVQRWLSDLAIKPWHYRSWISVRDPEFEVKAGRVLDLYARTWDGEPLGDDDFVICLDEKTSIQARGRQEPTRPPGPVQITHLEFDYKRGGAVAYMAALNVVEAHVIGDVVEKTGIAPCRSLVTRIMGQEPYKSARRVFFVVDNGSSHRPGTFGEWLTASFPNAIAVHLPIHASWLNQIEIFFSILQRKALTPNDLKTTDEVRLRILQFQEHFSEQAKPFKWRWTREDMVQWLHKKAA